MKELKEKKRKKKEEERKRKENKKINILKKKILEKEKNLREQEEIIDLTQLSEKERNEQLNEVLEDMCIYGNIMKKQIQEEKEKNPDKFIETSQALQLESEDPGLFALGLIAQNLEDLGIETAIEREENDEEEDAGTTCLQFITNGLAGKKKYDLHFEFDEKRNEELLDNEEEYEKFKKNLKLKLRKDYNISIDKIVVTFPQRGSFHVQLIFQSDEFNDLGKKITAHLFEKAYDDPAALLAGSNLNETLTAVIAKLGENIVLKRFARFDSVNGKAFCYIHSNYKVGALAELEADKPEALNAPEFAELGHEICMQIAAANPLYLVPEEVPEEVLNRERDVYRQQLIDEGKPADRLDKIIEGKLRKYYETNCLLEQEYIRDADKKIKDLVTALIAKLGENIVIKRFARFAIGE